MRTSAVSLGRVDGPPVSAAVFTVSTRMVALMQYAVCSPLVVHGGSTSAWLMYRKHGNTQQTTGTHRAPPAAAETSYPTPPLSWAGPAAALAHACLAGWRAWEAASGLAPARAKD